MISAVDALERLRAGNRRFVSGLNSIGDVASHDRRLELVSGQQPFAVILGCSDSRVPVEILFDQGLGDLFVVRVAGNIVTPALTGSVEYAVEHLGARLVVVLGHEKCGAVTAAWAHIDDPTTVTSPNLRAVVEPIRVAIEPLRQSETEHDSAAAIARAVRANVVASTVNLHQQSALLAQMIESDEVLIVGAEYSLATGIVDFLVL